MSQKHMKLQSGRVILVQKEKMGVQLLVSVPRGRSARSELSPSLPLRNLLPLGLLLPLPPSPGAPGAPS